jgi:hypothetical protein
MENEFLKIYSNLANHHITSNVKFLSESGTELLKEVERFCELWSEAKSLALKAFKSGKEESIMRLVIDFIWFPSLFSLPMNILVSASDSVTRMIRFILEGLELGLVLDCADEFKNLSLEEKLEIAKEFNSKGSLSLTKYKDNSKHDKESDGKESFRLVDLLDKLLEENTLRELKRFYGMISEKWIHASTHLTNLMTDESIKEWPPPKVLYFPPLEERKDEADELAKILREFNKYADILVKEWGKRYVGENVK